MEGLKGRVGFVAIGAYGGNQGELFYKAKYPVVFINTAQQDLDSLTDIPDSDKYHIPGGENHCIRAGTEGLHGNNGITEHTDRITESSGKCVQHFM